MKLISSVVSFILAIGMAWGVAQYLGDGQKLFSTEWFEASSAKLEQFQHTVADQIELPDPENMDLPSVAVEPNGENNDG